MTRWLAFFLMLTLASPIFSQGNAAKKKKKAAAPTEVPVEMANGSEQEEQVPRVIPVFTPGSHTQMIRAIGFNTDQTRLITVGEDASVQIWSTATGERLDILSLPSFGFEPLYKSPVWNTATISPDGRFVAIGGGQRTGFSTDDENSHTNLLLVDTVQRSVRPVKGVRKHVTALAFSADHRLAVAARTGRNAGEIAIYPGDVVSGRHLPRNQDATVITLPDIDKALDFLAFSPDNTRLCAATIRDLYTWDVSRGEPKAAPIQEHTGVITAIVWSPDSRHVARAWRTSGNKPHGIAVRHVDGARLSEWELTDEELVHRRSRIFSLRYLNTQEILMTCDDSPDESRHGATAARIHLREKTGKRVWTQGEVGRHAVIGDVSRDRRLGAITISNGMDAVIYRITDGTEVARCGAVSPVPTVVAWGDAKHPARIAWSETLKPGFNNTAVEDLECAFDLSEMRMIGEWNPKDFVPSTTTLNGWKLRKTGANSLKLSHNGKDVSEFQNGNAVVAHALIPQGTEPPLVAWAVNWIQINKSIIQISKSDGSLLTTLQPYATFTRDLVPSPDGRYLLASMGTHRMCIFSTEGTRTPILSLARANGEWVAWNDAGYYTASPGGEKMFGWAESHGPTELATFHPAEKFAKHFRRPDLLKRAIELGSMDAALKQGEIRAPAIENVLPPKCELKLVKQTGGKVEVRAVAISNTKDKPVVSMRLLLDGRPIAGGVGQKTIAAGEKSEASWQIEIPAGHHELKLLARNDDSSAVSDPLIVTGPKSTANQPVLHRLCVGINEYQLSAFNLGSAAKDAADVFASLEKNCVGTENRFGSAKGTLLTNKQATRAAVMNAITDIRKAAKPGDLVVFLFAGHGVKQQDEYYLMTHEADPNVSLKGKSLSGEDLRTALSEMECPVLLIMDACHSARGVKAFRPATDDLTRSLTDDTAGVTVLAAAMAHEVASATQENGYFTAALLKALQVGRGVPFDPHDHVLYTHHVYSVVFSEVRKASNGKQNPFLNMPWTVPPLAVREVPQ